MSNFIVMSVCFIAGILLRRSGLMPENSQTGVNMIILNLSLPAVALTTIHSLPLSMELLYPALMAWIVFIAAAGFFFAIAKVMNLSRTTTGCLVMTGGLGNTSFVGLPMITAFYGSGAVGIGMICDQAGSFLTLSLLGIPFAAMLSGREMSFMKLLKRVIFFPPMLAVMAALLLKPVSFPPELEKALAIIGGTLSPLALLSIGLSVRFSAIKGRVKPLFLGLGYKMFLAPLLVMLVYVVMLGQSGEVIRVTIFEAAMPPQVVGAIIASEYGLEPELAALMLGVGVPLSFATLAGWWWLLQYI